MTIFHVIKYQVTDIFDQEQLDQLPDEVIDSWVSRLRNYAIEQAESVVHLDTSGTAEPCIDATRKYLRGEITKEELEKYQRTAGAAAWAAEAAAAGGGVAAWAAEAAVGATVAAVAANWTATKELFHKWLMQELEGYEMNENK
jgi:F0F1-type ATP synthase membrane subunit c/vacuolar-type H+-ATPase subunit K